ncbi:GFA family protein [Neorhizobium sp. NPDC001467]|uniref:GFA family protein n=1 Tax=Neorhizobium sp. NPDC001467 TaxID=3390595 RepID=UPI003D02E5D5
MSTERYVGGCQCGALSFEADADLDKMVTCNCPHCQHLGAVLAFTPRAVFSLKSGEENLTEYRFNSKKLQHLFCKTRGIRSFSYGNASDGAEMVALDVNCLEGVNPRALTSFHHDGAAA